MKQLPLAIVPDPADSFDDLVVGANQHAVQHLRSLPVHAAPVYLWGPSGSGKTRLLRALAAQRQARGERVVWFQPDDPLPWALPEACELVLLDRCDALDEARQLGAFGLFVQAGDSGAQWAAAGQVPPVDLPLREDLRSRLGWGHVFALQALTDADTRRALRLEADRRGIVLSDEVMGYLLTRLPRNLKHLMDLLSRLDGFALAEHRHVTVPLLKKMLSEEAQHCAP